jgi:hypothetical protein
VSAQLTGRLLQCVTPCLAGAAQLFRTKDKLLRETIFSHIVSDIRNINRSHHNEKVRDSSAAVWRPNACSNRALRCGVRR